MSAVLTDWAGFRAAVVAAVSAALPAPVLATTSVAWEDGPREQASGRLILSEVSTTYDDRDSALSTGGLQTLESMVVVTVQIRAESTFDSPDANALWLIEQCRLGLRKVSVNAALEVAGIVVQAYPPRAQRLPGIADGHALSMAVTELVLCTTFGLTTTEDAGLIEHVEGTATVTDDRGSDIDLSFTIDDPDPEP